MPIEANAQIFFSSSISFTHHHSHYSLDQQWLKPNWILSTISSSIVRLTWLTFNSWYRTWCLNTLSLLGNDNTLITHWTLLSLKSSRKIWAMNEYFYLLDKVRNIDIFHNHWNLVQIQIDIEYYNAPYLIHNLIGYDIRSFSPAINQRVFLPCSTVGISVKHLEIHWVSSSKRFSLPPQPW